jgi:hypothetical protein
MVSDDGPTAAATATQRMPVPIASANSTVSRNFSLGAETVAASAAAMSVMRGETRARVVRSLA